MTDVHLKKQIKMLSAQKDRPNSIGKQTYAALNGPMFIKSIEGTIYIIGFKYKNKNEVSSCLYQFLNEGKTEGIKLFEQMGE